MKVGRQWANRVEQFSVSLARIGLVARKASHTSIHAGQGASGTMKLEARELSATMKLDARDLSTHAAQGAECHHEAHETCPHMQARELSATMKLTRPVHTCRPGS